MEKQSLKYVSTEYQEQLDKLAETLMASRRLGALAVEQDAVLVEQLSLITD